MSRRSSTVPIAIETASATSSRMPVRCAEAFALRLNTTTPEKASAMPSQRRKGTVSPSQIIAKQHRDRHVDLVDDRHRRGVGELHAGEDQREMQTAHEEDRGDQHVPLARHRLEPRQTGSTNTTMIAQRREEYRRDVGDADLGRDRVEPPRETDKDCKGKMREAHGDGV